MVGRGVFRGVQCSRRIRRVRRRILRREDEEFDEGTYQQHDGELPQEEALSEGK